MELDLRLFGGRGAKSGAGGSSEVKEIGPLKGLEWNEKTRETKVGTKAFEYARAEAGAFIKRYGYDETFSANVDFDTGRMESLNTLRWVQKQIDRERKRVRESYDMGVITADRLKHRLQALNGVQRGLNRRYKSFMEINNIGKK